MNKNRIYDVVIVLSIVSAISCLAFIKSGNPTAAVVGLGSIFAASVIYIVFDLK